MNVSFQQIRAALGGEVSGGQVLAPGPGHSPKDRSLSVAIGANGELLLHSFAGDDWRVCQAYVYAKLGLPADAWRARGKPRQQASAQPARSPPTDDEKARWRRREAARIWREAQNPAGTLTETYLRSRRLELPPETAGEVIRFHAACPWRDDDCELLHVPAMIALMRDVKTDEPVAIQRTRLSPDGAKIDRKMLGQAKGAVIKLDADAEVTMGLVIGEGLETTLTARQRGLRPCWALGSVGAIERFPLSSGIVGLTILAEAGAPSAKAVKTCGARWAAAGRDVIVIYPREGDSDVNDSLRARQ